MENNLSKSNILTDSITNFECHPKKILFDFCQKEYGVQIYFDYEIHPTGMYRSIITLSDKIHVSEKLYTSFTEASYDFSKILYSKLTRSALDKNFCNLFVNKCNNENSNNDEIITQTRSVSMDHDLISVKIFTADMKTLQAIEYINPELEKTEIIKKMIEIHNKFPTSHINLMNNDVADW